MKLTLHQRHLKDRLVRLLVAPALVLAMALPPCRAPARGGSPPEYICCAQHDPEGSGKFYLGREIARVMGHQGASWLDRPEREAEERLSLLLKALELWMGEVVADIGAGSGFFSFRMAPLVAPKGKVYAVDIAPEMLELIRQRMEERKVTGIQPVLGTEKDPKLPPRSVDLILLVDVYHEFSYPWEMARAMIRALKPGGKMVFVEYRLEDPQVPIKRLHRMSVRQVRKEMAVQPVRWLKTIETLPRQHVIIFQKPAHPAAGSHPAEAGGSFWSRGLGVGSSA